MLQPENKSEHIFSLGISRKLIQDVMLKWPSSKKFVHVNWFTKFKCNSTDIKRVGVSAMHGPRWFITARSSDDKQIYPKINDYAKKNIVIW